MSSVACCAQHFFTLSHIRHDFRQKLRKIKCVFRFSLRLLSETFFILRRTEPDTIKKNYTGLHVSNFYSCHTLTKLEYYRQFFEISYFMNIRPVEADIFQMDGEGLRTDRHDEANSSFSKFCERAKKRVSISGILAKSRTDHLPNTSQKRYHLRLLARCQCFKRSQYCLHLKYCRYSRMRYERTCPFVFELAIQKCIIRLLFFLSKTKIKNLYLYLNIFFVLLRGNFTIFELKINRIVLCCSRPDIFN